MHRFFPSSLSPTCSCIHKYTWQLQFSLLLCTHGYFKIQLNTKEWENLIPNPPRGMLKQCVHHGVSLLMTQCLNFLSLGSFFSLRFPPFQEVTLFFSKANCILMLLFVIRCMWSARIHNFTKHKKLCLAWTKYYQPEFHVQCKITLHDRISAYLA